MLSGDSDSLINSLVDVTGMARRGFSGIYIAFPPNNLSLFTYIYIYIYIAFPSIDPLLSIS